MEQAGETAVQETTTRNEEEGRTEKQGEMMLVMIMKERVEVEVVLAMRAAMTTAMSMKMTMTTKMNLRTAGLVVRVALAPTSHRQRMTLLRTLAAEARRS